MYCDQVRKLFEGENYLRAETIRGNTVYGKKVVTQIKLKYVVVLLVSLEAHYLIKASQYTTV